jgi:hypothetical protein
VVFRAVHMRMRVLMIDVVRVLGMPVLVLMMLGVAVGLMVSGAVRVAVRVLMPVVFGVVRVAVVVIGVLGVVRGLRHAVPIYTYVRG